MCSTGYAFCHPQLWATLRGDGDRFNLLMQNKVQHSESILKRGSHMCRHFRPTSDPINNKPFRHKRQYATSYALSYKQRIEQTETWKSESKALLLAQAQG